jgi:hypothetical protein
VLANARLERGLRAKNPKLSCWGPISGALSEMGAKSGGGRQGGGGGGGHCIHKHKVGERLRAKISKSSYWGLILGALPEMGWISVGGDSGMAQMR